MSWQCFIDPPGGLLATGHVEMGGIYGHDGALWAASRGMESVLFQDIMDIKNIFFDPKKGFSRGESYFIIHVRFFLDLIPLTCLKIRFHSGWR